MADMATSINALIMAWSALATLPSQAYPIQDHHSSSTSKSPRSMPCQLRSSAMKAVTCVSANTKTRSKNSSSGVTDACSVP